MVYLPQLIVALLGEVSQSEFSVCANAPTTVETTDRDVRGHEVPDSSNSSMAVSND
jgi:hypothetical protein